VTSLRAAAVQVKSLSVCIWTRRWLATKWYITRCS